MHGEPPDEFGAHLPGGDGDTEDDGPLRGWVDPEDRLWLHPSERSLARTATPTAPGPGDHPAVRWAMGGVAACVVVAVVVAMALTTADAARTTTSPTPTWSSGVPTTEAGLNQLADVRRMKSVVTSAHDSTVALLVDRASGTSMGTGLVAEAGGIIVTLRPVVAGARTVTVVEPDGSRQVATPVGADATTGIAVLRVTDELPAAVFAGSDPTTGSMVVAMAMEPRTSTRLVPTTRLYAGTVEYAGIAAGASPDTGLCTTGVATPLPATDLGSPLVDGTGSVAGLLAAVTGAGTQRTAVFLPAELVRDVTSQIVRSGAVSHGTAGLEVTDVVTPLGTGGGAEIAVVAADGAGAEAGLRSGDVVVAVDGQPVRSVAELATRLYGDPPGSALRFAVQRNGTVLTIVVVLNQG